MVLKKIVWSKGMHYWPNLRPGPLLVSARGTGIAALGGGESPGGLVVVAAPHGDQDFPKLDLFKIFKEFLSRAPDSSRFVIVVEEQ